RSLLHHLPPFFVAQRARAASLARSIRCALVNFAADRLPPLLPPAMTASAISVSLFASSLPISHLLILILTPSGQDVKLRGLASCLPRETRTSPPAPMV